MQQKDDVDDVAANVNNVRSDLQEIEDSPSESNFKPNGTIPVEVNRSDYTKFKDYLDRRYDNNIPDGILQGKIEHVFHLGVIALTQNSTTTSTTTLSYRGSIPRKDVLKNLAKIAHTLKLENCYPIFTLNLLKRLIKTRIGPKDPRTYEAYLECIQNSSRIDTTHGRIDVSGFYESIPIELLDKVGEHS